MKPGASPLRDYVAARLEVADLVRDALRKLQAGRPADAAAANELVVKLAEDRFNLAVVGEFKRGKTTLMNAVIGRDLLPTGVLPLTSVVTALRYGASDGVRLRRRDSTFEQQIRVDQLRDYVTEVGNPGNEKAILEAQVELPHPFLRRGLHFVDTPGVGSASRQNAENAYRFLPQADAVIFVTSVDSPLGEAEERYLLDIREHVARLMVVVNKVDMVTAQELSEVLTYVEQRLAEVVGGLEVPVYAVSARHALEARLRRDPAGEAASGLLEFEDALGEFLANERGRTFLVRILDRLISVLGRSAISAGAADGGQSLGALLRVANDMRDRLLDANPLAFAQAAAPTPRTDAAIERALLASSDSTPGGAAGRRMTGCPVCSDQSQAVFSFFAQWQHELAIDRVAQQAFAASGGFCPAHTWQFQQIAAPQDLSAGYAPLVKMAQEAVARAADERQDPPELGLILGDDCAACRILRETERASTLDHLREIGEGGTHERDVLEASWCLRHLRSALEAAPDGPGVRRLLDAQAEQLEATAEDMRTYSLKRAALRRGIINTREADAWRRGLIQLVGERAARGVLLGPDEAAW